MENGYTGPAGVPSQESEDPEVALRDARQRFIAAFPKRSDSIGLLLGMVATLGPRGPIAPLRQIVHRTAGLAGTLGFPTVSARARDLGAVIEDPRFEAGGPGAADRAFEAIKEAFAHDLSSPPVWVDAAVRVEGAGHRVLVVEDDEDQREVVSIHLRAGGFEPVHVGSGDRVLDVANATMPSIILLDANLPGIDGYAVCRLLKATPHLSSIPVIFLTVRATLDDRLVGLMLGADDYMVKPFDAAELLLRMQLLLAKRARQNAAAVAPAPTSPPELDFETLALVAREELSTLPATLVLVRVPEDLSQAVYSAIRSESRRRDLVSRYDASHIIVLMAEMPLARARVRFSEMLETLTPDAPARIRLGLACSQTPGARSFEELLAEADEEVSLGTRGGAPPESSGEPSAPPEGGAATGSRGVVDVHDPTGFSRPGARVFTVVIASGAAEVSRTLDDHLRRAGFRTIFAADSRGAEQAVERYKPDVLVVDLSLPHMTGFEVLAYSVQAPNRPGTIVVASRDRHQDVAHAVALGADDYVTTPFSPDDLLVRIRKLLR
jgi:DNA-binding response OmpR family regulator